MSNCIYCGKPVGIFRNKHSECKHKCEEGKRQILDLALSIPATSSPVESIFEQIETIARSVSMTELDKHILIIRGWKTALENSLHDGVLSEEQEARLVALMDKFLVSREELDADGSFTRIVKSAVIRDVLNGVIPHRCKIEGGFAVNLQKDENIVWAFSNCEYLEDRTTRQYVGGSQGISVRVMKGLYYRTGTFKGQAIERTQRTSMDTGVVALTNKHIYFSGAAKSFRVPYAKIVSFTPYSNGIGIIRDAANAKPQTFITDDGWFIYNLATNLARL